MPVQSGIGHPEDYLNAYFTYPDGHVATLSLEDLYTLIDYEVEGRNRSTVITKLHRRLCTLRRDTERAKLEAGSCNWRG